jgi:NAD(P)-dependent dehydrogenase (short-subunit alcohol dehydrogenase family)
MAVGKLGGEAESQSTRSRVALVTGASRGLGRETARQLLARGLRVVLSGRDERAITQARAQLGGTSDDLLGVRMDVTDVATIVAARGAIEERFGRVDVIVNNAAMLEYEDGDPLAIPAAAYRRTFETNLFGAIEVCRAFVPAMAERGYGRVVNVSSGAGQIARMSTYAPAYSMSKAALNAFTRNLAAAYDGRGVLVNAADPGWVRTDMGGPDAPRPVEKGAETIVWLATLGDGGPTGGFFRDRRAIDW